MRNQIKAYISHSIRGKMGKGATEEYMQMNNQKAIDFGKKLSKEFPTLEFYVPGEHDQFVLIAYKKKYVTEEQILDVDYEIINGCSFMVVYSPDDYISGGMKAEIDHCVKSHIPIISAIDGNEKEYFARIVQAINCQLVSMMR